MFESRMVPGQMSRDHFCPALSHEPAPDARVVALVGNLQGVVIVASGPLEGRLGGRQVVLEVRVSKDVDVSVPVGVSSVLGPHVTFQNLHGFFVHWARPGQSGHFFKANLACQRLTERLLSLRFLLFFVTFLKPL